MSPAPADQLRQISISGSPANRYSSEYQFSTPTLVLVRLCVRCFARTKIQRYVLTTPRLRLIFTIDKRSIRLEFFFLQHNTPTVAYTFLYPTCTAFRPCAYMFGINFSEEEPVLKACDEMIIEDALLNQSKLNDNKNLVCNFVIQ